MIRSRDGEPLPDGKRGELVLTTLTRERMPMLRFGTKDITSIIKEKCPCGRTFTKIERIRGRTDDILKVRGKR
jgi:phenylacetate-CoA ligase